MAGGVFAGRTANEDQIESLDRSGYKLLAFAAHGLGQLFPISMRSAITVTASGFDSR